MKKYKWILGILISFIVFLISFFIEGAKSFTEVIGRLDYFKNTLLARPYFLLISIGMGLFVGVIFWIIKFFGEKEDDSQLRWILRAVLILVAIFLLVYALIRTLDFFAHGRS